MQVLCIAILSILAFEGSHQFVGGEQLDRSYSLNGNFKHREHQLLVSRPEAAATTRSWAAAMCTVTMLFAVLAVVAFLLCSFASLDVQRKMVPAGGKAWHACSSTYAEGNPATEYLTFGLQPDIYDLTSQDSPERTPRRLQPGISAPRNKSRRPASLSNWWDIANDDSEDQHEVNTFDMATEDTPCTTPCMPTLSEREGEGRKRPSLSSWWIGEASLSP